ncbi:MAG: DNA mismatch endonuclease Vsr [Coriobacteriaceae bacterium]|nr:DNA mismatch endonuclease Vsr [Coriobacteriaceae bacterium]
MAHTKQVAAGIIQRVGEDGEHEFLVAQRGHGSMEGYWEFPGGKIEHGETAAEACERELAEELNVRVSNVQDFYTLEYDYPEFHLSMKCFSCSLAEGEDIPEPRDGQKQLKWVRRETLATLEWMPANAELIAALSGVDEDDALVRRRAAIRKSMQGNKRRDTKPELLVRQRLRAASLTGYRLDWAKAPGRPDIAFPGRRIAIFVNGCYWHRCPHCNPSEPRKNVEYWQAKFRRNIERDREALAELEALGWHAITIWECELKRARVDETMDRVIEEIRSVTRERDAEAERRKALREAERLAQAQAKLQSQDQRSRGADA